MKTTYRKYCQLREIHDETAKTPEEQDAAWEELKRRGFVEEPSESEKECCLGRLLSYEEVVEPLPIRSKNLCVLCGYPLNIDLECPRGCTESDGYAFARQIYKDLKRVRRRS